jgi:hypothetical protein
VVAASSAATRAVAGRGRSSSALIIAFAAALFVPGGQIGLVVVVPPHLS